MKKVITYVLLAALAYGVIYYLVIGNRGAFNASPLVSPTPVITTWTVSLSPQNESNQTGTAMLTDVGGGQTKVALNLSNVPFGASEPSHIHVGSCPTPGAVRYPLNNVVDGVSETTISVSIDQLKSMLPLAINLHESDANLGTYLSCGDLK